MSHSTGQQPIITLIAVDIPSIMDKYNQGYYSNVKIPRVDSPAKINSVNSVYGSDPDQTCYSHQDRSGTKIIHYTTNQDLYNSDKTQRKLDLACDWCRWPTDEDRVGNPMSIINEYDDEGNKSVVFICDGRGCYCDESCGLAHFLDTKGGIDMYNIERNSMESNIRTMYILRHPNASPLQPAADYHLLCSNGGPMSREEYKSNRHTYVRSSSHILRWAKASYQRMTC